VPVDAPPWWELETFGEHHGQESGIFDCLAKLPEALRRAGVDLVMLSALAERARGAAAILPTPPDATTWAGAGDVNVFLGNPPQRQIFLLMHEAYTAKCESGTDATAIAHWLLPSDHLHMLHWHGLTGPAAEVSAYFTPQEW
jgi:alpha-amylase